MAIKANEVPQVDLLERDVKLMFEWLRDLRSVNDALRKENEKLRAEKDELKAKAKELKHENVELRTKYDELQEKYEELKERFEAEEQTEKDELAFYIKSQREARKLSFNAFGRILGVSGTTLQNYEKSKGNLDNMSELVNKIQKLRRG